jgi:RND family efflux transporter MFP subunit
MAHRPLNHFSFVSCIPILAVLFLWGCDSPSNEYAPPPPPSVTVASPVVKDLQEFNEFTGVTRASAKVELRARVKGFLTEKKFEEGTTIKKGDLLFVIDPAPFEATVAQREADLQGSVAKEEEAQFIYDQRKKLFDAEVTSETDLIQATADLHKAQAVVAQSKAMLDQAKLDLGYTTIHAPIDGRISEANIDVGNLVGSGESTLLATIESYDPMYAYFNLNELDFLKYMERQDKEKKERTDIDVFLARAHDEDFPFTGKLDYAALSIDTNTGTLLLRATFENPSPPQLFPGLFARLRMPDQERKGAILVPELAIGSDQQGKYVLTVNSDNIVEYNLVKLGRVTNGMAVILDGVAAGDKIIVNGIQRARPGSPVTPQVQTPPAAPAPAAKETPAS